MSRRQQQHHGRSTDDDRELPGRDVEGPGENTDLARADAIDAAEEARNISRAIDENEGYDREDHRDPQSGASRGRTTKS